jgi:hypothetical protein
MLVPVAVHEYGKQWPGLSATATAPIVGKDGRSLLASHVDWQGELLRVFPPLGVKTPRLARLAARQVPEGRDIFGLPAHVEKNCSDLGAGERDGCPSRCAFAAPGHC